MQKLIFHPKWDKTISIKDRKLIELCFAEAAVMENQQIEFTPLWHARNHKQELLVTAIVHNTSKQPFSFHERKISYHDRAGKAAEHQFSIKSLIIEPHTSMPWTFIFPLNTIIKGPLHENGKLEI